MFKWQIRREVKKLKQEIIDVESRMHRSHSACIQALLEGKQMPEEEVAYHKKYMEKIDTLRGKIRSLEQQLKS